MSNSYEQSMYNYNPATANTTPMGRGAQQTMVAGAALREEYIERPETPGFMSLWADEWGEVAFANPAAQAFTANLSHAVAGAGSQISHLGDATGSTWLSQLGKDIYEPIRDTELFIREQSREGLDAAVFGATDAVTEILKNASAYAMGGAWLGVGTKAALATDVAVGMLDNTGYLDAVVKEPYYTPGYTDTEGAVSEGAMFGGNMLVNILPNFAAAALESTKYGKAVKVAGDILDYTDVVENYALQPMGESMSSAFAKDKTYYSQAKRAGANAKWLAENNRARTVERAERVASR